MAGNGRDAGRSVASKIFAILGVLGRSRCGHTVSEISRATGLPATTVLRLLREMTDLDVVHRTTGRRYEIGIGIWRWGVRAPRVDVVCRSARPQMQELHQATRENVTLAVLDGRGSALAVEKVSGRESWPVTGELGADMPLHATGAGKVLLAFSPPEEIQQYLSGPLPRYTPFTVVSPALLSGQLREIRRLGVGYAGEEMNLGSVSIAAPVRADGAVVGALSLVGAHRTVNVTRVTDEVRRAARLVSDELARSAGS
ncbi:IclR family transcriptional regulator [Streptomyces sp. NPDC052042]|uniref:IclR family transcriptional regulator n=1 Tax=Streptomyces sp. NPDC052042 TaxID=3365683 RepID=UPI0037D38024